MRPTGRHGVVLLLAGLLVGAAVVPGTAAAVVRGSPDLQVSLSDDTVTAGENGQLELTLTNEGDVDAGSAGNPALASQVTTARGVDVTVDAGGTPISVETDTRSLGRLQQGGEAPLAYGLSVDEDATPGTYTLDVTAEYRYTSSIAERNGARNHETETRHFEVEVEIDDRARFEVVDTDAAVRVGSTGTVGVTMRNVGSEAASDATVALASENGDITFGESGSATRFVGDWAPGETRTVEYEAAAAESAEIQRYALTATANFEDEDGVERQSESLPLGVEPLPEQRFPVVDAEHSVAVGDTGTVRLTLENDGAVPVRDATVTLGSGSPALAFGESESATRFVGDWAPGETRTVEYDLSATDAAEARSYALDATVDYVTPDGERGSAPPASVGVTPAPERGFTLSNVSTDLRVGEEGQVRGTITNEGETAARNVVVEFTTENANVSPLETAYSVGTLEPGETADFAFTAEVGSAADAGPRQFSFVATYRDGEGETRTSDELLTRQRIAPGADTLAVEPVEATYAPGGGGELTVRVTNTADETLTDVSANLFADDPISVDDGEAVVAELAPGESTTLTFGVSAGSDAIAKSYPVSVDFQYEDADGDTHVSDSHQVPVTVAEPETDGGGGGLPLPLLGFGAVGVVGVGVVLRRRR
ncbi:COG1361 S-layer family protein [Halorientalis marina]|uniref:COG1361 S-layer family protein n=1 Tax=Halorientalis marina TaxID=2931976 RepID=UPI001FF0F5F5|nr:COG1361 S-layer family protein [Halorientalis marina]